MKIKTLRKTVTDKGRENDKEEAESSHELNPHEFRIEDIFLLLQHY